ncbi:MAG: hypothetical protein ACO1RX_17385 [Candidatus Sericytochromatia bacterium]
MSLTYLFYTQDPRSPRQILELIGHPLHLPLAVESLPLGWRSDSLEGVSLAASGVSAPLAQFMQEDFGWQPRSRLSVRLDKFRLALAQAQVVEILCVLRQELAGPLLLMREHDSVAYQRVQGSETIEPEEALWQDAQRLARFGALR